MSSLRNAVKRKTHKERAQVGARARHGLLEKRGDYLQRARDFHRKEDAIRTLRERAAMRNEDEFNFKMVNSRTKRGVHVVETAQANKYSQAELRCAPRERTQTRPLRAPPPPRAEGASGAPGEAPTREAVAREPSHRARRRRAAAPLPAGGCVLFLPRAPPGSWLPARRVARRCSEGVARTPEASRVRTSAARRPALRAPFPSEGSPCFAAARSLLLLRRL